MVRFSRLAAALLFVAAAANAAAAADSILDRVAETGELRIGYPVGAPPLAFNDADGKPVGYSIELCRHIGRTLQRELGLETLDFTYVPLVSMEDRLGAVERGEIDIECGATTVTLSRRERVDFTLMTFITGSAVLSRRDEPIASVSDVAGQRIAVMPDTTTEAVLREFATVNDTDVEIVQVDTHQQGMTLLNAKKVDGFASDRAMLIGQVFTDENARNDYEMTRGVLSFEPYALMIPRGDTRFRLAADRALAELYRSVRIRRLYQDWFGQYGEPLSPIVEAMYQFQAVGE